MSEESAARIIALRDADDPAYGGKAMGLARLLALGLPVPPGFVVAGAKPGALPETLAEAYAQLGGGAVAVRSSAVGEDGEDASFAGQYETVLGVEGEDELVLAIERCLASRSSARADAYAREQGDGSAGRMSVIVQRMVDARAAGVLFTADPVTGRRAHVVVDAVEGLGEALVSGHASPDHYVLDRAGHSVEVTLAGERTILQPEDLAALVAAARAAEAREGRPLDLEWAIDRGERIYWLQARPITRLGADPTELDTPILAPDHVFTRCNIGEMFPGACTPLSFSFSARGIDVGMQLMHRRLGIRRDVSDENVFVGMFHRNLFLNLTSTAATATQALGSSADQMALSICGRRITEVEIKTDPPPPWPRRIVNGSRYLRYLLGQRGARRSLRRLRDSLDPLDAESLAEQLADPQERARACFDAIDARFEAIYDAMDLHLISSAGSGVLSTTLLAVIAGGEDPTETQHAEVAGLLAGAEGVESADIAAGADRVRDAISARPDGRESFADAPAEGALAWLESAASGEARDCFRAYLERHGHRTVKELELRQPEWREDPLPLVRSLQAGVRGNSAHHHARLPQTTDTHGHGLGIRILTRMARQAVRAREETKSGLVDVTTRFKRAYRRLAAHAVEAGMLPDPDALFFLTQEELGRLIRGEHPDDEAAALGRLAVSRREIHDRLDRLAFPDVFVGVGEPEPPPPLAEGDTGRVTGSSVSRGCVEGTARVVQRLEDAEALQEGEILIAPITDVGWTPYFSVIAGLVTDVGSAVSHGAVVAREYGLPAVVNTRHATRVFQSGDRVRLDADMGVVEIIEPDGSDS